MKLTIWQRLVLRFYGIRISDDGTRITIPSRYASMVNGIVDRVTSTAWVEGTVVEITGRPGCVTIAGPGKTVEVRVV